jgi:hypothetical protein
MNCLKVTYDAENENLAIPENSRQEDWQAVCERYHDDVHRIKAYSEQPPYTAIYACFDEENRCSHFLVEENAKQLFRARHRVLLSKLGQAPDNQEPDSGAGG